MNRFEVNVRQNKTETLQKRASYYGEPAADFTVTYTPVKSGIFNLYIFGVIESASQFINAIEVLSTATPADEVHVHLSTDGGSIDATDTFLSAMNKCEAKVVCHSSGGTHSAGTIILLNADEFSLSEGANFLIHNGSCSAGGKTSDFIAQSKHTISYMNKVLRKTYKHFLTEQELDQLIDGKDFWMDAEEFSTRYELRNALMMEEYEKAEAALNEAIAELPAPKKAKKQPVQLEN